MPVSFANFLIPSWLIYVLIYALMIKAFERRLTFKQSFLMSAIASVVSMALGAIFYLGEAAVGALHFADRLVGIGSFVVSGAIITRLARNYGVEKSGWLGVGAKATLCFLLLVVVLAAGPLAIGYLYFMFRT